MDTNLFGQFITWSWVARGTVYKILTEDFVTKEMMVEYINETPKRGSDGFQVESLTQKTLTLNKYVAFDKLTEFSKPYDKPERRR